MFKLKIDDSNLLFTLSYSLLVTMNESLEKYITLESTWMQVL